MSHEAIPMTHVEWSGDMTLAISPNILGWSRRALHIKYIADSSESLINM